VIILKWEIKQDVLTVYPVGDLDMATAGVMKEEIETILYSRLGVKTLVVNLNRIRFIDSSGLGMLIGCYKYMQGRGGGMMLVEASKNVYRILEFSGMKKLMPVLCEEQTK
jgi:stage II sporulation protein AA (anti-sigma F factor antagonist)